MACKCQFNFMLDFNVFSSHLQGFPHLESNVMTTFSFIMMFEQQRLGSVLLRSLESPVGPFRALSCLYK